MSSHTSDLSASSVINESMGVEAFLEHLEYVQRHKEPAAVTEGGVSRKTEELEDTIASKSGVQLAKDESEESPKPLAGLGGGET